MNMLKSNYFRSVVVPGLLIALSPPFTLVLCAGLVGYDGQLTRLLAAVRRAPSIAGWAATQLPRPTVDSIIVLLLYVAVQLALLMLIPGRGYLATLTPAGDRPWYKLNGVQAYLLTLGGFVLGTREFGLGWWDGGVLYDNWGTVIASGSVVGLFLSAVFYVKGLTVPSSRDAGSTGAGLVWDFFWGTELHPTVFGFNAKQLISCRVSMNGWALLGLSFALKQRQLAPNGQVSPGMAVSAGLLLIYLLKFFCWESGYFGSMDVQHDRVGFYLVWGLFAWVPAVYVTAAHHVVAHRGLDLSWSGAALVFAVGLVAIYANWEADDQRQRVRESAGQCLVWGRPPKVIRTSYTTADGRRHSGLLLHSGWWGVSRHCHYLTELTTCFCWSVAAGFDAVLPWFYVIFLTILLFDRAYRDELRCSAKYGKQWDEYMKKVPYRIIPYLY